MDNDLGQTLLVSPETPFTRIASVMEQVGLQAGTSQTSTTPLLTGEPEFFTWTWQNSKPHVIYTFNPVARLRVLDVATVPPALRGMIASQLPILDHSKISNLFFADDPRQRLLGLWAAQETEEIGLVAQAERLQNDTEAVVAEQARLVTKRLQRVADSRVEALANLRVLAEAAPKLIMRLDDPQVVTGLQPNRNDIAALFDEELADSIFKGVTDLYKTMPRAAPGDRYPELKVTAANAGLLRWSNELSDKFPRGYRDIAGWMVPNRIWLSWEYRSPEGGSVLYDGLVFLDDHWVWIPKVFRIVAPLVMAEFAQPARVVH